MRCRFDAVFCLGLSLKLGGAQCESVEHFHSNAVSVDRMRQLRLAHAKTVEC